MANLQIKGIDDNLYNQIKQMASQEHRSISQQVLFLVKTYLSRKQIVRKSKPPAKILVELSGSWEDSRSAAEIIDEIKTARKPSTKLKDGF